jgi:hypothetical protein
MTPMIMVNDLQILHLVKTWLLAPYTFLIKTYTSTLGLPQVGTTHNQIDQLLGQRRNASSSIDVRTCRGASCGSDHRLVKAAYRCQIMIQINKYQQKEPKTDVGKLNTPDNREKYQKAVQENIRENGSWNINDIVTYVRFH